MKIIHVTYYYNDGLGYQDNILPRYQQNLGNEVKVITTDLVTPFPTINGNASRKHQTGEYNDGNMRVIRLPHFFEFKNRFVCFKGLKKVLESEKPDYIFHHGLTAPSIITCAMYKRKNPSVFLAADNHADLNNSARNPLWGVTYYRTLWTYILKKLLAYIDLIFGVTPARCFFTEDYLGIPPEKIRLLPLGADTDTAKKVFSRQFPDRNGDENSQLKLVTGGKWTKEKGLEKLLEAVQGLDLHLEIFGIINDIRLKEKIDSQKNVSFQGWKNREDTIRVLAGADIALWPGPHTTLMEDAIATETPLLLRYHDSTSHHLRGNGLYFFSDNPLEIRQMLQTIMGNPEILRQMKNCAEKQRKILSYDQVAEDSLAYFYDKAPQLIHRTFMDDPLCKSANKDFHKIGR